MCVSRFKVHGKRTNYKQFFNGIVNRIILEFSCELRSKVSKSTEREKVQNQSSYKLP